MGIKSLICVYAELIKIYVSFIYMDLIYSYRKSKSAINSTHNIMILFYLPYTAPVLRYL